ncbi:MAG TPA: 3'(2'),5'-bisphosphate nucleotidase CysQ [Alphaproteobacteria bacterium]|nr:3'(2'),5'-bisphosphate nucleotidase CysQ [Alphaproteobacteria bacterium]
MLTAKQLVALLPEIESLAREAGAAIMGYYQNGPEIMTKGDGSPVTAADLASDAIIAPGLAALTPEIPVVSEEGVEAGRIPDISGGSFWLVDPLDGTKEFIGGTGEFTVLIGLIQAGVPALGVLYGPVADELYSGAVPGIAWSVAQGNRRAIQARAIRESGLLTVTSSFRWPSSRLEKFLESLHVGERVRRRSAFKYADVARGAVDLYPAFGMSYEWDSAAGHALVSAAGGSVTLVDGSPLAYGKPQFKNPDLLVVGRR